MTREYIGAFGRGSRRNASLIDRPSANEGRQARTINHRLSVLASYFAFRIRQDDDRGDGAWHQHSNPVSTPDDERVGERIDPGSQQLLEIRQRVSVGHDAEVVSVGLGDEEFNHRPGHQLTPAVLPDFDEVGLLRNQLLNLPFVHPPRS
jgi:hypothetical protein